MNVYYDSFDSPTNLVSVGIFIRVGSLCEKNDQNGFSHFLEHMLFTGTKEHPSTELLNKEILKLGCEYNAHTSYDYTGFYITCQKENLPRITKFLKSMMQDSIFNNQEFTREKHVICQEIEFSNNKSIMYYAHKKMLSMIYGPGGTSAIFNILGTKKSIKSAKRKDLMKYWKKWYQPKNMLVVISGSNLKTPKSSPFPYLKLRGAKIPTRINHGPKTISMRRPGIDSGYIYIGFYTLDLEASVRDTILIELLLKYLCRSFNSVLHKAMRIDSGLSYSVRCLGSNCFFNHLAGGFGYKGFVVSISEDKIPRGLKKIKSVLKHVRTQGIPNQEALDTVKNMFTTSYHNLMQTTLNRIFYYGTVAMKFPRLVKPQEIIKATEQITMDDFNKLTRKLLVPDRTYTILIKK